ncbi:MAG TPA: hypothetical protein VEK85_17180 [Gemmatimonadales bacterium]|nr:hypothetical protein [Gemmatimonadales bacterium]
MSTLSSFFTRATGQKLSTVVGAAALGKRGAQAGGGILLLAALGVGAYFLLKKS